MTDGQFFALIFFLGIAVSTFLALAVSAYHGPDCPCASCMIPPQE